MRPRLRPEELGEVREPDTLAAGTAVRRGGVFCRNARPGIEARRALSVPHRALDRDVGELPAVAGGPQQQPAPAHVAAPDEIRGKEQPRTEDLEQGAAVLVGGDAAEEDDAGLVGRGAGEALEVAHQGPAIGRFRRRDRDRREPQHVLPPHGGLGWQEAGRRRDHEDGARSKNASRTRACRGSTGRRETRTLLRGGRPRPNAAGRRGRSARVRRAAWRPAPRRRSPATGGRCAAPRSRVPVPQQSRKLALDDGERPWGRPHEGLERQGAGEHAALREGREHGG